MKKITFATAMISVLTITACSSKSSEQPSANTVSPLHKLGDCPDLTGRFERLNNGRKQVKIITSRATPDGFSFTESGDSPEGKQEEVIVDGRAHTINEIPYVAHCESQKVEISFSMPQIAEKLTLTYQVSAKSLKVTTSVPSIDAENSQTKETEIWARK